MTVLSERLERLQGVSDSIAPQVLENLDEQSKKAAANMLLLYGSKSCLDAGGFILCIKNAHEAALLFLLDEGDIELTDKGRASAEERQAKANRRNLALTKEPSMGEKVANGDGAYL